MDSFCKVVRLMLDVQFYQTSALVRSVFRRATNVQMQVATCCDTVMEAHLPPRRKYPHGAQEAAARNISVGPRFCVWCIRSTYCVFVVYTNRFSNMFRCVRRTCVFLNDFHIHQSGLKSAQFLDTYSEGMLYSIVDTCVSKPIMPLGSHECSNAGFHAKACVLQTDAANMCFASADAEKGPTLNITIDAIAITGIGDAIGASARTSAGSTASPIAIASASSSRRTVTVRSYIITTTATTSATLILL
jgi:hypothetical protein